MKNSALSVIFGTAVLTLLSSCGGASSGNQDNSINGKIDSSGCDSTKTPYGGGTGKENDPYLLCSVPQLKTMAESYSQDNFALTTDLDLSEEKSRLGDAIAGVLDGRNHILRNFHVKTEMGKAGGNLVGNLVNPFDKVPEIKNLYLENFTIEGEGLRNAAALLMHNAGGRVINVHVSATISGEDTLGGIVAINAGKILNSSFTGTIQGTKIIGGIVGKSHEFSIENCKVSGKVSGESSVGGIVGELSKSSYISDNEVEAEVTGKEDFGKLLGKVTP